MWVSSDPPRCPSSDLTANTFYFCPCRFDVSSFSNEMLCFCLRELSEHCLQWTRSRMQRCRFESTVRDSLILIIMWINNFFDVGSLWASSGCPGPENLLDPVYFWTAPTLPHCSTSGMLAANWANKLTAATVSSINWLLCVLTGGKFLHIAPSKEQSLSPHQKHKITNLLWKEVIYNLTQLSLCTHDVS